jgi:hypothetical protein
VWPSALPAVHKNSVSFHTHFNCPSPPFPSSPPPSLSTLTTLTPQFFLSYSPRPPLSSESSMATLRGDHGQKPRCSCIPRFGGPNTTVDAQENRLVSMTPSDQTSSIGMFSDFYFPPYLFLRCCSISESPELPSTTTLGASQGQDRSFESLKLTLSSRGGRESLYVLPIEQAIEVIGVLERVSAK